MKNEIKRWYIFGAVFIALGGTALHFLYDITGQNSIAALFGSVNESTWEHLKLYFWPTLFWGAAASVAFGWKLCNFIPALAAAELGGMLTILILYYTCTGILGFGIAFLNVIIFYLGAASGMFLSYSLLISGRGASRSAAAVSASVIAALGVCFAVFTNNPPDLGLFREPAQQFAVWHPASL